MLACLPTIVFYIEIHSPKYIEILQEDLEKLALWAADCQMKYNLATPHQETDNTYKRDTYVTVA